jgi:predicted anti-sigma-YlaC factor YlaD
MEKPCKDIEQMLVDYTDGQLPPSDSNKVAEHVAQCENCRKVLDALNKSFELAGIIWKDSLAETENIRIPATKTIKIRWSRYAAIAASILLVATGSIMWHTLTKPKASEMTFAEIEREITESGNAARLLAAAELLNENPKEENIVKQQYRYIVETYPKTAAASKAKSRIK